MLLRKVLNRVAQAASVLALSLGLSLSTVIAGAVIQAAAPVAHAAPPADPCAATDGSQLTLDCGTKAAKGSSTSTDLFGSTGVFKKIANVLIFVIGSVAVLMVIVGALRYVLSGGDAKSVEGAKNTILYAIVGVIVAILSYAIVDFVIANVK